MNKIEEKVNHILAQLPDDSMHNVHYGTSFDVVPFGILTTKVPCYKVWVMANIEGRVDTSVVATEDSDSDKLKDTILMHTTEYRTEAKAQERVQQCIHELAIGMYHCLFCDQGPPMYQTLQSYMQTKNLPKEAIITPDKYLEPGDVIGSPLYGVVSHWGIYIGNGEVVHVSAHNGSVSQSRARIGRLCPNFVVPDSYFWKINFYYRFRKPDHIVDIAKDFAEYNFRQGSYSLLTKNCQHFAILCAWGLDISPEADKFSWFKFFS